MRLVLAGAILRACRRFFWVCFFSFLFSGRISTTHTRTARQGTGVGLAVDNCPNLTHIKAQNTHTPTHAQETLGLGIRHVCRQLGLIYKVQQQQHR